MKIDLEAPGEAAALHAVVAAAFGRADEARLVDDLRQSGDLVLALVARSSRTMAGYVALSRLASPPAALALAPLAVLPAFQRRGIGAALLRRALAEARERRWRLVFVLGDPGYYGRFGFTAETAAPFPCPYAGPSFMALSFGGDPVDVAPVAYPPAFASLA